MVSPPKMAELINMSLGIWTCGGPRSHALDRVHVGATWRIRWIDFCSSCDEALCYQYCSKLLKLVGIQFCVFCIAVTCWYAGRTTKVSYIKLNPWNSHVDCISHAGVHLMLLVVGCYSTFCRLWWQSGPCLGHFFWDSLGQYLQWYWLSEVLSSNDCHAFNALTLLVGWQKEHPHHQNWVVRCCHGYMSGARCKWLAHGPANATATPSSLLQQNPEWFILMVLASRVILDKKAVKWLLLLWTDL